MNGIISIKGEISSIEMKEELEKVKGRYPVHLQEDVKKAFQAAEEEDFENASELCCKLLDEKVEPEICMLLGTCYFMMGNMHAARTVFSDLVSDHPKEKEYLIYLGIADHALGRYEEAVKELESLYPLKEYRPFYYTSYGDSLLQLGKEKESRDAFYGDVEFFKNTEIIVSPMMLDGAFQNLLYLDITLGNGKYPEDIKLYYSFLEQIEMTEEMQEALAGNIVYFCELMANKWYRPLFLDFITHIREKGYLKDTDFMKTLDSAFASWESYLYHEDRQVSQMMEAYLSASYKRTYVEENVFMEEETSRIEAAALTYMWYMCQYIPEHPEEMDYIEEHYPYAYADNKAFFGKLKSDPENTAEELLDELYASYVQGASRSEFIESMNRAYKKACENKKESAYVYDGPDTYRRIQPKVGRNAPCPCGSGKKYKKCCGR